MYIKVNRKYSDIIGRVPREETVYISPSAYIKDVKIPDNITEIEDLSFQNFIGLIGTLNLNKVTKIGSECFGSSSISKLIFNEPLEMGPGAFANMTFLEEIEFKQGAVLGDAAFVNCTPLTNINKIIGWENTTLDPTIELGYPTANMFESVPLEGEVIIPSGWTFLPPGCFMDTNINSVILHDNIKFDSDSLGACFHGCKLDTLTIPRRVEPFNNTYLQGLELAGDLLIPNTYTDYYHPYAFGGLVADRVIFENGSPITTILSESFGLDTMWSKVQNVREWVFSDSVTTLQEGVSIKGIAKFNNLTNIGDACTATYLYLNNVVPPTVGTYFLNQGNEYIIVPDEAVDTYKLAPGFVDHAHKIISITEFESRPFKIDVIGNMDMILTEYEINVQTTLISELTTPVSDVRINVTVVGKPEGSTLNIWYRDGVNPDVDVAALGYIPPELGESIDTLGRPFTKIAYVEGDKYNLPLFVECDLPGEVELVFEILSLSSAFQSATVEKVYSLEAPFDFRINTSNEQITYNPGGYYEPRAFLEGGTLATSFTGRLEVTADLSGLAGGEGSYVRVRFGDCLYVPSLSDGVMVPVQWQDPETMDIIDPVITVDGSPYNNEEVRFTIEPAEYASGSFTITINLVNTDTSTIVTSKVMTFNLA